MYLLRQSARSPRADTMAAKALKDDVVDFETSGEVEVTPTFDALGLREDLLRGIYAYGAFARLHHELRP